MAHEEHHDHDAHDDHGHDDHGHGGYKGLGHVVPFKILAGVGATLLVLTVVTVLAARVHFGQFNLIIALGIATLKAGLVALFFMHLRWDRPFHAMIVVSGIFAAMLFVGIAFMDGNQYQRDICAKRGPDCKIWRDLVHEQQAASTRGAPATPAPATPAPATPAPAAPVPATP